ncbi:hypothetical protein IW261DRAFT_1425595 [Armillaria novae-zelandiae]|uniref:Heterokaryon incompatibility domain-containing protein n=1 Tax=Armillaria novae-zelandiae TaxID=153914 RepID=A0AA39NSQ9_9AGAR|nr:hypothetical protein IW261DRAFT_1425595 [Armillaria novae-zelandiae]
MSSQRAPDIYVPLLLPQGYGYPLWLPGPLENLPSDCIRDGTQIGDLGYLADDGGFVYLFNVGKDASDPVNLHRTPPDFTPLPGIHERTNTQLRSHKHQKNSRLEAFSKEKKQISGDISAEALIGPATPGASLCMQFTSSSTQAVCLALPDGGEQSKYEYPEVLEQYAMEHAHSWYKHFNGQGRQIRNVIGLLAVVRNIGGTLHYNWELSRVLRLKNPGKIFKINEGTSKPPHIESWVPYAAKRSQGTGSGISQGLSEEGTNRGTARSLDFDDSEVEGSLYGNVPESSEDESETAMQANTSVQQLPGRGKIVNPLALINEYTLNTYPDATVAVTHDDFEWTGMEDNVQNPLNVMELAQYAIRNLVSINRSKTTPNAWVAKRLDTVDTAISTPTRQPDGLAELSIDIPKPWWDTSLMADISYPLADIFGHNRHLLDTSKLSAFTETGRAESSIEVPNQRWYSGRSPVIPRSLADTPCATLGAQGVLDRLNATLGTSYTLPAASSSSTSTATSVQNQLSLLTILKDCIQKDYDFGTAYAHLRPTNYADVKKRTTPINGKQWPVPIPKDADLNLIRIEMLNLGLEYVWLDVLCLRQKEEGGPMEDLRVEEWKLDVPTIGACVSMTVGCGVLLEWAGRAWTLQERGGARVIAGDTPDGPLHAERNDGEYATGLLTRFHKQLISVRRREYGLSDAITNMQKRVSTNPVDRVAVLAFLLQAGVLRVYHENETPEDAWTALVNAMHSRKRGELLFMYPGVGLGSKKWRPTWDQYFPDAWLDVTHNDEMDEDSYYGLCIQKGYVRAFDTGSTENEDRCGELVVQAADGIPHTFKIHITHRLPIPEDTYTLFNGGGHHISINRWVIGRQLPKQRFEKVSIIAIDYSDYSGGLKNSQKNVTLYFSDFTSVGRGITVLIFRCRHPGLPVDFRQVEVVL